MGKARFAQLQQRLAAIKNSPRNMDRLKTAVILLLFLSAAVLAALSGLFDLEGSRTADSPTPSGSVETRPVSGSTKINISGPYVIAVTGASGSRCGLMYDSAEVQRAYDSLSAYLGEALGSAEEPVKVGEEAWRQALGGSGVYFDFSFKAPLSLLADSMGIDMNSSAKTHSAGRFCLSAQDDSVSLYYVREEDNGFYKCATAVSVPAFTSRLADYTPNGAKFLFETEYDYDLVDNYFLVPEGQPQIQAVAAQNPLGDADASMLMELLDMNSYLAVPYTETDGIVYVDGSTTLRIGSDGQVTYKNSGEPSAKNAVQVSLEQAVSKAANIAASTIGSTGGEGTAVLNYVSYDEAQRSYTVRYAYQINGLAVSMGSRYAMSVTMVDGIVTQAEINFREYSRSGEDDLPMPALQAMAVVQAKGGGTPVMCYVDSGGAVEAGWAIVK